MVGIDIYRPTFCNYTTQDPYVCLYSYSYSCLLMFANCGINIFEIYTIHIIILIVDIASTTDNHRMGMGRNNNRGARNRNQVIAEKSIQILRWLSIFTFLFLLGQTFLFTEKMCQDTAPTVWYYCLVIIILVYVSLVCNDILRICVMNIYIYPGT